MLSGAISLAHDNGPLRPAASGGFRAKRSSLDCFAHLHARLEEQASEDAQCFALFVFDRPTLELRIDREGVSLSATHALDFPVYYMVDRGHFRFSWNLSDLASAMPRKVRSEVARTFLRGMRTYSTRTLYEDVSLLTERSTVHVDRWGKISVRLPADALSFEQAPVRPNVDLADRLAQIIGRSIAAYDSRSATAICELSGGFDSTTVALVAAQTLGIERLRSYGVMFPLPGGTAQRRRRDATIALAQTADAEVNPDDCEGFLDRFTHDLWVDPYDEPYSELIDLALSRSGATPGVDVVLTGIGGDECMLPTMGSEVIDHDPDWRDITPRTPKSRVPETSLMACMTRAPLFLRRGLIAANPFCDLAVVEFSELVPNEYKVSRRLQKALLLAHGLKEADLQRPHPENFECILRAEMQRIASSVWRTDPQLLIEHGLTTLASWRDLAGTDLRRVEIGELSRIFRLWILRTALLA